MSPSSSHASPPPHPGGRLRLDVALERDADSAELEDATMDLRDELLGLDVDDVDRVASGEPAPPGARGGEVALLAGLAVQVGRASLGTVVTAIQQWVARRNDRTVKLTLDGDSIELSNVAREDQRRLIETFVARHAPGSP
jgi:hypothetical protein